MGHHWREPQPPAPVGKKPSPLLEFLGLLLSAFRHDGLNGKWLPFDPSPRSIRKKPTEYES
ncbi:MAG: hypothetical protein KGJ78_10205 [Alphaproteobacteria bacterium]|nr:hypothetical protein [Alphaproteobacteria bacterium]